MTNYELSSVVDLCNIYNISNESILNLIFWDSIFNEKMNDLNDIYGINIEDFIDDSSVLDEFSDYINIMNDFISEMLLYPNKIDYFNYIDTVPSSDFYGVEVFQIQPKTFGIDIRSLTSVNGLFILGDVVYKFVGEYLITFPIYEVPNLINYCGDILLSSEMSDSDLESYNLETYNVVVANYSQHNMHVYSNLPSNYNQTHFEKYLYVSPYDPAPIERKNGKIVVDLWSYNVWGWWNVPKRRFNMRIRNYKAISGNGTITWVLDKVKTSAQLLCHTNSIYEAGSTQFYWMPGEINDKKIKDKTFSQKRLVCPFDQYNNYWDYFRNSSVNIYNVYLHVSNSQLQGADAINYGVRPSTWH